jgi:hypothetical protein
MRELPKSAILAVLFLIFTGMPHAGFIVVFFAPFIIVGVLRRAWLSWKRPDERRLHGVTIGIWLGAVAIVAGAHTYYFYSARASAESVLQSVVRFKDQNGVYPLALADIGKEQGQGGVYYGRENDRPILFYHATFTPFDTYNYDFQAQRWLFYAD